jgi:hypothetical protein
MNTTKDLGTIESVELTLGASQRAYVLGTRDGAVVLVDGLVSSPRIQGLIRQAAAQGAAIYHSRREIRFPMILTHDSSRFALASTTRLHARLVREGAIVSTPR